MKLFKVLITLGGAAVIGACGGGGEGGGIGGTGRADVSLGAITAFGSVWVNGVEFNSDNATIRIDDNPRSEADLRVGMIARIDGSIASATANTISVSSAAKGYVESVAGNQLVVMGQTVVTDAGTTIANGPIAAGHYVEVHGLVVSDGTLSASFVERKNALASPPFAVKGFVKSHNTTTNAFVVGALNVTMGTNPTLNDMPAGSWNGLQVEVKGTACAGNPPASNVCGVLTASKVEPHGPRGDVANVEVEGFITQFTSASSFSVGGQAVTTTASTVFEGGVAADIVLGTKVEVEGSLSGGVLTARKVSLRESIRFEANVATKGASTLTLAGLNGITVETNALTDFKNVSFANLAVGNNLRIRGRPGANNTVIATELELRDTQPDSRVIIQAVASAVSNPNVTLAGFVVNTTNIPDGEFKDVNDVAIGRAAFFAAAAPGKLIKARGTLSGNTIVFGAQDGEIEFED